MRFAAAPPEDHVTQAATRRLTIGFGLLVVVLAAFCIFVLPFWFPPHVPVRSEAYAAGFSNKVAEIAAGLLSLIVGLFWLRFGRANDAVPRARLGFGWLVGGVVAGAGSSLALGITMIRTGVYFGESQYFLTQLEKGLRLHGELYRDVQFAYGPLLYWWPALFAKAGLPMMTAYVAALVTMQAAGFALFYYVVNALPLSGAIKRFAFAALAIGALSPSLGLNYSLFRIALPMAAMVVLGRSSRWAFAVAGGAVLAGFAVSAEAGVACVGGALAYAVYHRSGAVIGGMAVGLGCSFAVLGRGYFQTVVEAGQGGFDLLLTPEPRTLMLLVAAIGMAPVAAAQWVRAGRRGGQDCETGAIVVAVYGAAMGSLPVALGRCDAGHEYFFGMGCVLLSLVALGRVQRLPARVWLVCVVALVAMTQRANLTLYRHPLAMLRGQARGENAGDGINVGALETALGGHAVTPLDGVPWRVNEALMAKGLIAPSFYCQLSGVWNETDERRKIADLRRSEFALNPGEGMSDPGGFLAGERWRGVLPYHQRQQPFVPGLLIDQELTANWVVVGWYGRYGLLRRVR